MSKYLVKFQKCEQITGTDYDVYWVEKLFDENTTIKEIKEWAKSKSGRYFETHPFTLLEVKLSEPEQEDLNNG